MDISWTWTSAAQGLDAQDIETARFCKEFPDVTLACEDGQ